MKLTIALANYNRAWYLDRSIRLIAKQTLPQDEYELIIVDDGSTDESDVVIKNLKSHGFCKNFHYARRVKPRTRYGNCAIARNIGAKLGTGDVILFSDPEVMPMPDWAETFCKTICDNQIETPNTGKWNLSDPVAASWNKPISADNRWTMGLCLATRENHIINGEFVRPGLGNVFAEYDWLDMPTTWDKIQSAIHVIQKQCKATDKQIWDEFYFYRFSCGGIAVSRRLFDGVRGFEEDFADATKGLDVWSGEEVVFIHTLENHKAKWIEEPTARAIHIHHNISTDGGKGNAFGKKYILDHPELKQVNLGREYGLLADNGFELVF